MIQGVGAQTVQIVRQTTTTLKSNQNDLAISVDHRWQESVHWYC
ncbi:hypothetical protein [Candidatus Regiella insecticola]|nr:hypothetical protein [Candidatus Regiella insecticola]